MQLVARTLPTRTCAADQDVVDDANHEREVDPIVARAKIDSSAPRAIFDGYHVVVVPRLALGVRQAARQVELARTHGATAALVAPQCGVHKVAAARTRVVCVVCVDEALARRVVRADDVPYVVYNAAFVPHSIRDGVVKHGRPYTLGAVPGLQASHATAMQPAQGIAIEDSEEDQLATKNEDTKTLACVSAKTNVELAETFPTNALICNQLTILHDYYHNAHTVSRNVQSCFRAMGYQRTVAIIRRLEYDVATIEDVADLRTSHPAIGERLAAKLQEIVKTGQLREAQQKLQSPACALIRDLCNIWGVGPYRASVLIESGVKSINDLHHRVARTPILLDRVQRIGLKHYNDFRKRIPRAEVMRFEMYLRRRTNALSHGLVDIVIAGSYLRGKRSCGDIDCMLRGRGDVVRKTMHALVNVMCEDGILTDHLVRGDDKYFGVCRLKPGWPHRRIDLFAVPTEQFPFALLTYTGSATFNRSVRLRARRMGYSLSHTGIVKLPQRKASETASPPVPETMATERDIFRLLHIPFKPPQERDI